MTRLCACHERGSLNFVIILKVFRKRGKGWLLNEYGWLFIDTEKLDNSNKEIWDGVSLWRV